MVRVSQLHPAEKYNPEYHFYPSFDPTGLFYYGGSTFLTGVQQPVKILSIGK